MIVKPPDGKTLAYTYDAAQYLRTVTDHLGNKIEYGYDLKGNRVSTQTTDPDGTLVRALELVFDARNRVATINDGGGLTGSLTKQLWDAVGNLVRITDANTVAAGGTAATVHAPK